MSELDAFISYSHRDDAFAGTLARAIEARGRQAWIDGDDIPPGAPWRRELGTAIEAADAFVFVISPDSIASEECGIELARAVSIGKRLIAIDHREARAPPAELRETQWIRGRPGDDIDSVAEDVLRAIDTDHEWLRGHTQWLARALRWDEHGRDRSRLLRGRELADAERWLAGAAGREPAPTALQTQYVTAGRHAERHRLRLLLSGSLVGLAIAIALAGLALVARAQAERERRVAQSRELAASAFLALPDDPELSLILAVRAARIDPNAQAEDALRQALLESRAEATLTGHRSALTDVAYSPDGATLATAAEDGTVRLWHPSGGPARAVLRGHESAVTSLEFSRDGRLLLSSAQDHTARVWDVASGEPRAVLTDPDEYRVQGAAFSPDARMVAMASFVAGGLRIWDVDTRQTRQVLTRRVANDVEFSPDGDLLLTTDQQFTARLWDVSTGRVRAVLPHAGRYVWRGAFSADGRRIATVGSEGEARIWDGRTGRLQAVLRGHRGDVRDVAFSPDGSRVLTAADDRTARVWSARTGRAVAQVNSPADIRDVAFGAQGTLIAVAGSDGIVRLVRARDGDVFASLRGHRGQVRALAFGRDDRLVSAGADATARVWSASPENAAIRQVRRYALPGGVVASTPDARLLVTTAAPATDGCWIVEPGSGRTVGVCRTAPDRTVLAVDDRGRRLLTRPAPLAQDGDVEVTEVATGSVVARLKPPARKFIVTAAFDSGGARALLGYDDGRVEMWDAGTGRRLLTLRAHEGAHEVYGGHRATSVRFGPEGSSILTASDDRTAKLWDASGGRLTRTLREFPPLQPRINPLAQARFSRDGSRVIGSAPWSDEVLVWDARTGSVTTRLKGHANYVTSAEFSPDGRFAVTTDRLDARLWDARSGRLITVFARRRGFTGPEFAWFGPDGESIVIRAGGAISVHRCQVCMRISGLRDLAARRATRALSPEERATYLHE